MLSSPTWIKLNASRRHSCYIQLETNCQYFIDGGAAVKISMSFSGIICSVLMIFKIPYCFFLL